MFRSLILVAAFISLSTHIIAQDNESTAKTQPPYSLTDHLVYGGNLGLNFGNVTSISVSPMVGYKVTEKFIPGIGLTYNYLRFRYPGYISDPIHIYGGSLWARYYILDNVFAHGEYEALNGEWEPYARPGYRYSLNSALVGVGYREGFGGLSSYILLLYNVTYSQDSPYPSPFILRVGLGFGM